MPPSGRGRRKRRWRVAAKNRRSARRGFPPAACSSRRRSFKTRRSGEPWWWSGFCRKKDSIRWECEVRGDAAPWSTPLETRLHCRRRGADSLLDHLGRPPTGRRRLERSAAAGPLVEATLLLRRQVSGKGQKRLLCPVGLRLGCEAGRGTERSPLARGPDSRPEDGDRRRRRPDHFAGRITASAARMPCVSRWIWSRIRPTGGAGWGGWPGAVRRISIRRIRPWRRWPAAGRIRAMPRSMSPSG